jgi:hypothetical protein
VPVRIDGSTNVGTRGNRHSSCRHPEAATVLLVGVEDERDLAPALDQSHCQHVAAFVRLRIDRHMVGRPNVCLHDGVGASGASDLTMVFILEAMR